MAEDKPFCISKWAVWAAWRKVRANQGAAGIDDVSVAEFEKKLNNNLYRIWNRMSSGSYVPPPVRRVMIPKPDGRERPLGIPTVGDRVAQMAVKMYLEPKVEPLFHPDSYGYRPNKSALDAVGKCRQRCWRYNWIVDLDIKGFFDNIDHSLMMYAVRKHTDCRWALLYVERWLKAPAELDDGTRLPRERGTPQGGVASPLLANIFLHHVFDMWMAREFPGCPFERYADDVVIHCRTEAEAQDVRREVEQRLLQCKLEAHPEKTRIVYCRDSNRTEEYPRIQFDFLGYGFRPRRARNSRDGCYFVSFVPAISRKAMRAIVHTMRDWRIHAASEKKLDDFSRMFDRYIRGWVNYYGRYYPSALHRPLSCLNRRLVRWAMKKYKRYKGHQRRATRWLRRVARKRPELFAHWRLGIVP
jgi:RNA-directed DNA polymerase